MRFPLKVSVVIPAYNAERFILSSVYSILNQTYDNTEILICDDASTDNSFGLLKTINDDRIVLFQNKTNQGYLRTINQLLKFTKGDFIAFQDADDISHVNRIEMQLEFLAQRPEISLVGTNFNLINQNGSVVLRNINMESTPSIIKENLIKRNLFQKPSILFKRRVYDTIDGFREGFLRLGNISEDYDWLLRASEKFELSNLNYKEPLYSYRSVSTAMSKKYTNIEQHIGAQVAQFLALERRRFDGIDSLMTGNFDNLKSQIELLKLPYYADQSLFYFEKAEALMYAGLYFQAFEMALKCFIRNPLKWRNLRCLLSTMKKISRASS